MKVTLTAHDALGVAWDAKQYMVSPPDRRHRAAAGRGRDWLAALRLTEGVPFQHLVVDDRLLRQNRSGSSTWTATGPTRWWQARCPVSAITTDDRAQLQALYPQVRDELDAAERLVRVPGNEVGVDGPRTW